MTHPPIPLNSDHFVEDHDWGDRFIIPSIGEKKVDPRIGKLIESYHGDY